jgi:membrane associated rhomboid family serine protease
MVVLPTEKKIDWTRPPIVVAGLIAINILVFLFTSVNDQQLQEQAFERYQQLELYDREWEPYQQYRTELGDVSRDQLASAKEEAPGEILFAMAFDPDFARFVSTNDTYYSSGAILNQWRSDRTEINQMVRRVSTRAFGLGTDNLSIINLLTHQFLHGGWMHLLGNMVFLLVCGFAVEAAIGSRRFLLFYLFGGVCGGLLFWWIEQINAGTTYLIGASGAISAVLAMYVTLFRLKKIEFFYWAFIVVGYFRAPAVWLLPFYLGMELIQWLATDESNVAYTAHIGGFIAGAAAILIAQRWQENAIDESYLDEDQQQNKFAENLDRVYRAVANYDFSTALSRLEPMISEAPDNMELRRIKHNLVKVTKGDDQTNFMMECIDNNYSFEHLDEDICDWWQSLSRSERRDLSLAHTAHIAMRLLNIDRSALCEEVFTHLQDNSYREPLMAKIAMRLAYYFERQGLIEKSNRYQQAVQTLTHNGVGNHTTGGPVS